MFEIVAKKRTNIVQTLMLLEKSQFPSSYKLFLLTVGYEHNYEARVANNMI